MKMIDSKKKNKNLFKYNKYYHGLFDEISRISSVILAPKNEKLFYMNCNKKINVSLLGAFSRDINYQLEQLFSQIINDLLISGRLYLKVKIENIPKIEERTSIDIEIKEITRKDYYSKKAESSKEVLDLNIKDTGFSKNHFKKISKILNKYDLTSNSVELLNDNEYYSFNEHKEKSQIESLKATKNTCLLSETDGLSDSYFFYKTIQQNSIKRIFINYIIDKINNTIGMLLGDKYTVRIITNYRTDDYKKLWDNYVSGEIVVSEMMDILY